MSVGSWVEGWRQHSEKMARRQEGCASWDNEADGCGKMGRVDSSRQWVGRDDQRLRDIIQVVGIAELANLRQDLIHLLSSWGETTGQGWGCQDLSQRVVQLPSPWA